MTYDEMINVIQAHREGKKLQCRVKGSTVAWTDIQEPSFDFGTFDYRVKVRDLGARLWFWRQTEDSSIFILGPDGRLINTMRLGPSQYINDGYISADGLTWELL